MTLKFRTLKIKAQGFTLIEVLIALAIISIALTALLLTTSETIKGTHRLRDQALAHLVATQALTLIQADLSSLPKNQDKTEHIALFGKQWFWHAKASPTHLSTVERIEITASPHENGPFNTSPVIGFRSIP
ncbi:MAG: type II secretion system minor pseudopilin GspI [Gammaproteobacteria bacterium]|nr:type II secretion system minor pseudopilin GspI [Gammaproteobacteria bacterium]MCH9763807.1 type II secretion system minor pseudopilin GspI [Gammaproteobacteria bacterium]